MENLKGKIITVKSNRGLSDIIHKNGKVKPTLFRQTIKDPNADGEYVGEYNERPFPKSNRFFAPEWDNLRNRWHFFGDEKTFQDIVRDLRLKYPSGHKNAGEVIEPGNLEGHLKDFSDPIFKNPALYGRFKIQGGSGSFNMDIPLERFAYYCERDRRDYIDKTNSNVKVSGARRASARFLLESPTASKVTKAKDADLFMSVMEKLISISNDEKKLRACCVLLNVPRINERSDIVDLKGSLTETLKENLDKAQPNSKYRNVGEAFIDFVSMPDETLQYMYIVAVARKKGLIRVEKDGFRLKLQGNIVFIPGPNSSDEVYAYLTSNDEKAAEQFVQLMETMKELKYI